MDWILHYHTAGWLHPPDLVPSSFHYHLAIIFLFPGDLLFPPSILGVIKVEREVRAWTLLLQVYPTLDYISYKSVLKSAQEHNTLN